ncbi:MAG TPA: sulfatase-like hydrolase/transferase, partial [Thermoanaerobaculia bacterium]|nr:sulfatase-like hydrolase/transferase [Thermoanaerobaculia bacterium]
MQLAAAPVALLLGSGALGAAPAHAGAPARPNLVLITLDTTRADHLGAWGHGPARTPRLDRLAREGVRFERCDTAAPITLPSHATILSGLFPPRHGARDNGTFALGARVETVAEALAADGFDTAAVVSAVVLARRHGLDQGFRVYDDDLGAGYAQGTEVAERDARAATDAALARLGELRAPFFLWAHYIDPHEEYRPPSRFADAATGPDRLYDGEIAYVDDEVGRLLDALPGNTVVVVVGDHGEQLGEHGESTHGLLLNRGVRRVPLLLWGAGIPAGRTPGCLVRTADVAPTLLELAGLAPPTGLDGRSLLPLLGSGEPRCDRVSYTESYLPFFAYRWYPLRSISDGGALYLQAPVPSLYRLDLDPGETVDLAAAEPALAGIWRDRLRRLLEAAGESLEPELESGEALSEEQLRQLASLGYLGGSGGGRVSGELPDPRSRLDVARELHEAAAGVQQGRCAEVLDPLLALARRDPHNFPALTLAGQCLRDAGRREEAAALFRRAAVENDRSTVPPANLGALYLELGRREEAERELRRALVLDPAESVSAARLARLLRENGRGPEAIAVLDRARAAGAHAAPLFLERGTALAEAGRLEPALADFLEAARRDPSDPTALENAGRAAFALGRVREAAIHYETLARRYPERGDLWKTLGSLALELGEPER